MRYAIEYEKRVTGTMYVTAKNEQKAIEKAESRDWEDMEQDDDGEIEVFPDTIVEAE